MRWTAWLVLAATLLLWSGNWIVARAVREEIAPGIATAGRLLVVLAILLPFAFSGLRLKLGTLTSKDWRIIAALGFTGGGVHLGLQWLGLHYIPLGERVGARQWAGVLVSFCGVFLIATRGEPAKASFVFNPKLQLDTHGYLAVLYSAIGSFLLAYTGWSYVVKRMGAVRAGVTMHLMPAFGVALSSLK